MPANSAQSVETLDDAQQHIALADAYSAHNYHPLPVVVAEASGVWVTDVLGRRYMDMLAAYSAVNFGHCPERLVAAATKQMGKVTLTSRAFHNDQLGPFCKALTELSGMEAVLPMNTGAEAVETGIKTARKWGYEKKGVPENQAKIIVCDGNFHGRTTTVVSFSTDAGARQGFGPFTPGFEVIPYGDLEALKNAIDDNTVAFLIEPIQGEAGVVTPPKGFLKEAQALCRQKNVLLIADEIQSGLGRTGATFTCEHEGVQPDMYLLGKALGGGVVPISAMVTRKDILSVIRPGDHGSTFGGNPLACAVALEVIDMLASQEYQRNAERQGRKLFDYFAKANHSAVEQVRGKGLWLGVVIRTDAGPARPYCERLMQEGLLCKETHEQVIRLAPPLSINDEELDWAIERLDKVLAG